jgi:hypothetical protein
MLPLGRARRNVFEFTIDAQRETTSGGWRAACSCVILDSFTPDSAVGISKRARSKPYVVKPMGLYL